MANRRDLYAVGEAGAWRPRHALREQDRPADDQLGVIGRGIRVGPMSRPPAIQQLFLETGRATKLYVARFMYSIAPDEYINNMKYISVVGKLMVTGETTLMQSEESAHWIAQCMFVGITETMMATREECIAKISEGIRGAWASIPVCVKDTMNPNPPAWVNTNVPIPLDAIQLIVAGITEEVADQNKIALQIFTSGILACCKQGNATTGVQNKVINSIQQEMGMTIALNGNAIRSAWNIMKGTWNPDIARVVFQIWEEAVGTSCMRIRLLINQAAWSNMTNYQNIIQAFANFPRFPWAECAKKFSGDFSNFKDARRAVGNDQYYGYRHDLGAAKSTLYPNLSYLAYRLLMDVGGQRELRDFQGTNRNTPHAGFIDKMVTEYLVIHNTVREGAPTDAEQRAVREAMAVPDVQEADVARNQLIHAIRAEARDPGIRREEHQRQGPQILAPNANARVPVLPPNDMRRMMEIQDRLNAGLNIGGDAADGLNPPPEGNNDLD